MTLCDPTDCSPPGSSVHQISQAKIPERAAISFSTRLGLATVEIRVGFGTKRHPFLGSKQYFRAGAIGLHAHCHRSAAGKGQRVGPQHFQLPSDSFCFQESQARGTYSSVVQDAGLSHKLSKSLGLEAVAELPVFLHRLCGTGCWLISQIVQIIGTGGSG